MNGCKKNIPFNVASIWMVLTFLLVSKAIALASPSLISVWLQPSHPEVHPGDSFTAKYQIDNDSTETITGYLLLRSRSPEGYYRFLTDSSGVTAVPVIIAPGVNEYERECVLYDEAKHGTYRVTCFVSPTTNWVDAWDYTIIEDAFSVPCSNPDIPQLISPTDNQTIENNESTLQWTDAGGESWVLQILKDGSSYFMGVIYDQPVHQLTELESGNYQWRVSACRCSEMYCSDWTSWWSFNVLSQPDIFISPTTLNLVGSTYTVEESTNQLVQLTQSTRNKVSNTLQCNIPDANYKVQKKKGYHFPEINGNHFELNAKKIGDPLLPARIVRVLVPQDAEFSDLKITVKKRKVINGPFNLYPKQPETPVSSKSIKKFQPLRPQVVTSGKPFPETIVEFLDTAHIRGAKMFVFRIWPIQYQPQNKSITINQGIEWEYRTKTRKSILSKKYKKSSVMEALIKSQVVNPEQYDDMTNSTNETDETDSITYTTATDTDYLIITNQALSSSFQSLADLKESIGLHAQIVTTESIYSNYTGEDNQEKIKSCIIDYATNYATLWVLLGGDDTIIPDRNCYGFVNSSPDEEDDTIPTDLFYAGLDDLNWDDDGDGVNCETDSEGDSVDLYPDVFIGRAPVRTADQAAAFVNKTIAYVQTPSGGDFSEKMLLCGVELWNTWNDASDAQWRTEDMWTNYISPYWDGEPVRFFDTDTDFGGSGYDVTDDNLQDQINDGYGLIFVSSHGSQTSWEMETGGSFSTTDANGCLNQNAQGLIYTMACSTNAFDAEFYTSDPCLSEAFLRNENGGSVAYIGSSRYGWGYSTTEVTPGPSFRYAGQFFRNLFDYSSLEHGFPSPADYQDILGAVHASHKMYYAGDSTSYGAYRWLQFSINLMGDPHLSIITENPNEFRIFNKGTAILNVTEILKEQDSNWLSFSPTPPFEILPDCQQSITVFSDLAGLATGTYSDKLIVHSNDPDENVYDDGVFINLTVPCQSPVIKFQPLDVTIDEGQDAIISIEAIGTATMHYQWEKNGIEIGDDSPYLHLESLRMDDDGADIWCVVSNDCGNKTSETVKVTVNQITCTGDFDLDFDVDGFDLKSYLVAGNLNLEAVAMNFGKTICP